MAAHRVPQGVKPKDIKCRLCGKVGHAERRIDGLWCRWCHRTFKPTEEARASDRLKKDRAYRKKHADEKRAYARRYYRLNKWKWKARRRRENREERAHRDRMYRLHNAAKLKEKHRRYYQRTKKVRRAKAKAWYEANRAKVLIQVKEYALKNHETVARRARAYRASHKEQRAKWLKANPERVRQHQERRKEQRVAATKRPLVCEQCGGTFLRRCLTNGRRALRCEECRTNLTPYHWKRWKARLITLGVKG